MHYVERRINAGAAAEIFPSLEVFTSPVSGHWGCGYDLTNHSLLWAKVQILSWHFQNGKVIKAKAKIKKNRLKKCSLLIPAFIDGEVSLTDKRASIAKFMAETLFGSLRWSHLATPTWRTTSRITILLAAMLKKWRRYFVQNWAITNPGDSCRHDFYHWPYCHRYSLIDGGQKKSSIKRPVTI